MRYIILFAYLLILFAIYVYAENHILVVRKLSVRVSDKSSRRIRAVQITDIHHKKWSGRICSRVRELAPDVIFLTGDLVSRDEKKLTSLQSLLRGLKGICPVFACRGNHELDLPAEVWGRYLRIMEDNGVVLLDNSTIEFMGLKIVGTPLKYGVYKNPEGGYSGLESFTPEEMESEVGKKSGVTVLLAHNPFFAETYSEWGADVIFSGHVHGGIVRLPVIGGMLSPERRFFPRYSKGVYRIGDSSLVVSGGVGKLRVFNPPEIVFCEIDY